MAFQVRGNGGLRQGGGEGNEDQGEVLRGSPINHSPTGEEGGEISLRVSVSTVGELVLNAWKRKNGF